MTAPTSPAPAGTGLRLGSLCSGYGGLDMAVAEVLPVELAWVADPDPGATAILAHHHPTVPNLGDITAVDWDRVERVDVLAGGYPCQPFSRSGKRKGTSDARHLWPHIAHAIRRLGPRLVVLENVAGHRSLGFDAVLGDLARLGFDAEWTSVRASDVGAAHARERVFILAWHAEAAADTADQRHQRARQARERRPGPAHRDRAAAHTVRVLARHDGELPTRRDPVRDRIRADAAGRRPADVDWGPYAAAIHRWERVHGRPAPGPVDDRGRLSPPFVEWLMGLDEGHVTAVPDLPRRRQQLHHLGNGVVPAQAAAALRLLLDRAPAHLTAATGLEVPA